MSDDRCPSTFLRNECQLPTDHTGNHCTRYASGHTITWTDSAADQHRGSHQ